MRLAVEVGNQHGDLCRAQSEPFCHVPPAMRPSLRSNGDTTRSEKSLIFLGRDATRRKERKPSSNEQRPVGTGERGTARLDGEPIRLTNRRALSARLSKRLWAVRRDNAAVKAIRIHLRQVRPVRWVSVRWVKSWRRRAEAWALLTGGRRQDSLRYPAHTISGYFSLGGA